jgi:peptide/nickel transport system substrate-binding protein
MTQGPFVRAWAGGLMPGSPEFERESVVYYPYAPEAAKALLADLGFQDTDGNGILNWTRGPLEGQDLTVALTANEDLPDAVTLAESLVNNWSEVGIQVNVQPVSYAARQEIEQKGEWEMHVTWSLETFALPFAHCSELAPITKDAPLWHREGDQPRRLQPFEEELVKLVKQYCSEQDQAQRKALINQYNHIFTENVYDLGVLVIRQGLALAKRFHNIPSGIPIYLYNWVEYSIMPEQIWTPKEQQLEQTRPHSIPVYSKK